jgi:hypothetical protein
MAGISERVGGEIKPEVYFLKYAFPCAFIAMQRGRINQATYRKLEKAAIEGEAFTFKELEKFFPAAVRRIFALNGKKGYKKWSIELIRDYFWNEHNKLIEAKGEDYKYAPASLCGLCKVLEAKVVSLKEGCAIVRFNDGKRRAVMTNLVGKLKPGSRVMVHYGYAVERFGR